MPLQPDDCERFAFSITAINFKEPVKEILLEGIA